MIRYIFRLSITLLKRGWINNIISLAGLVVSFSAFTIVLLWVKEESSFDSKIEKDKPIYRILKSYQGEDLSELSALTQYPLGPAAKKTLPSILEQARVYIDQLEKRVVTEGKTFFESGFIYADQSFPGLFALEILNGNKTLENRSSIFISESASVKLFGSTDAVGKILMIGPPSEASEYTVAGVFGNLEKSHLEFDYILPFEIFESYYRNTNQWLTPDNYYTYIQTVPAIRPATIENEIKALAEHHGTISRASYKLQPVRQIHLGPEIRFDTSNKGSARNIIILLILSLMMVATAVVNFLSLKVIQTGNRKKLIIISSTFGAPGMVRNMQLGTEIFILLAASVPLSLVLISFTEPALLRLLNNNTFFHISDQLLCLGSFAIITLLLAMILIKRDIFTGHSGFLDEVSPVLTGRKVPGYTMVLTQFALSTVLLFCTYIVYRQVTFMKNSQNGYKVDGTIMVTLTAPIDERYPAIKEILLNKYFIEGVTCSNILPDKGNEIAISSWETMTGNKQVEANFIAVDNDFTSLFGIEIIEGKNFTGDIRTDENCVLINQSMARRLNIGNPVGKKIMDTYSIIGVTEDYNYMALQNSIDPLVIFPVSEKISYIYIRLTPGADTDNRLDITRLIEAVSPGSVASSVELTAYFDELYNGEDRFRILMAILASITLLVSATGMSGFTYFLAKRGEREAAIRKINGASGEEIICMLSLRVMKWVLPAIVISMPVGIIIMDNWLKNYAFRIDYTLPSFLVSPIIISAVALFSIMSNAISLSKVDPARLLSRT